MHGEEWVDGAKCGDKVSLPRLDGSLGSIALLAVRRNKLEIDGGETE